ncbi:ribosomal protein L23a, putative [Eimeria brunetti]|uniref:Ribosomal protein L23a, putative n=1 Tax=Eimeria brunetti TaxID=51314 RepID=U6LN56_9EIME|nr:ribosomal protein L23a, putative [Eimeria brunetti]
MACSPVTACTCMQQQQQEQQRPLPRAGGLEVAAAAGATAAAAQTEEDKKRHLERLWAIPWGAQHLQQQPQQRHLQQQQQERQEPRLFPCVCVAAAAAKGSKAAADKKTKRAEAVTRALKKTSRTATVKARYNTRFYRPRTLKKPRCPRAPRLSRLWTANPVPELRRKDMYFVLQQPVTTESAMKKIEEQNTLVFLCNPRASKKHIKDAVKEMYGVQARKVNTLIRMDGKKKAYVRLTPEFDALDVANKIGII